MSHTVASADVHGRAAKRARSGPASGVDATARTASSSSVALSVSPAVCQALQAGTDAALDLAVQAAKGDDAVITATLRELSVAEVRSLLRLLSGALQRRPRRGGGLHVWVATLLSNHFGAVLASDSLVELAELRRVLATRARAAEALRRVHGQMLMLTRLAAHRAARRATLAQRDQRALVQFKVGLDDVAEDEEDDVDGLVRGGASGTESDFDDDDLDGLSDDLLT